MPVATVPTDILEPSARNSGRNRGKSPIIRRIVPTKRIQPNMRHRVSRGLLIEAEKDITRNRYATQHYETRYAHRSKAYHKVLGCLHRLVRPHVCFREWRFCRSYRVTGISC